MQIKNFQENVKVQHIKKNNNNKKSNFDIFKNQIQDISGNPATFRGNQFVVGVDQRKTS